MATKAKEDGPADTTFTQEEVQALVAERVSEATLATEETLRDQYASKLPALVEKITVETREAVSAELLSDPNIAGAKQALEGVKEFLRPYVLPEDAAKVVAGLETKVSDLAKEVKERDLQIEQLQTENQELEVLLGAPASGEPRRRVDPGGCWRRGCLRVPRFPQDQGR